MRRLCFFLFLFCIKPTYVSSQCEWQQTGCVYSGQAWQHTQYDGNVFAFCVNNADDINQIQSSSWAYNFDSDLTNDCMSSRLFAFNDTLLHVLPIDPANTNSSQQLRHSLIDASNGSLIGYQDVGGRLGCFDRKSRYQFGVISLGNSTYVRGYNLFEDNLIQYPISLEIGWDKLVDATFDGTFFYFLIQEQGSGASVFKCNLDGEVILQSAPPDGGVNIQYGQIYYVPESENGEIRVVSDGGSYYSLLKSNLEMVGINQGHLLGYTSDQVFPDVDVVVVNNFLYRLTVNETYVNTINGGYASYHTGAYLRKYDYDSLALLDSCSINSNPSQQHLDLVNEKTIGLRVLGAPGCNHTTFILIPQLGCTDPIASNYNPGATEDDGNCEYTLDGCTIEQACNYDPDATDDDGSCVFVGDSCDDGDETTANDTVQDDCSCSGEAVSGCTYSVACNYNPEATVFDDSCYFVGDPCDDGYNDTVNDTYDSNCECVGESGIPGCTDMQSCNYNEEANVNDGSCLYAGDTCDDENEFTENDAYTTECECIGDEIEIISGCTYEAACNYNPEANQNDMSCLFPGDECDDNDASTGNDIYNDECECDGEVLQGGCTYEAACNYNPEAEFDNNTCVFVGDPCDDGDLNTLNDEIQEDCECAGTPYSTVNELEDLSVLIYPNPASNKLTVDLGDLNGVYTALKLYDSSSKLVFEKKSTSILTIDVSGFAKGMYSLELSTDEHVLRSQVIID